MGYPNQALALNPPHFSEPKLIRHRSYPASHPRRRTCFRLILSLTLLFLFVSPFSLAPADNLLLEELFYRVDVLGWPKAVGAKITFVSLGKGRYRSEISGEAQGLLRLLTGNWRGRFITDMEYLDGRLRPVIYREEGHSWGKQHLYEYRFSYERRMLELYKGREDRGLVKEWEAPLEKPIYDLWSALYNLRLGLCGPLQSGETLSFTGIPYPKPEEISFAFGSFGPDGRKVMISLMNRIFGDEHNCLFVYFNRDEVPTSGWTRILQFGKVTWKLLPESRVLEKGRFIQEQGKG